MNITWKFVTSLSILNKLLRGSPGKQYLIVVPSKLIRLITLTLANTKARVRISKDLSEKFLIKDSVRQGDSLSALVFSITMYTIAEIGHKGKHRNLPQANMCLADDVILARTSTA